MQEQPYITIFFRRAKTEKKEVLRCLKCGKILIEHNNKDVVEVYEMKVMEFEESSDLKCKWCGTMYRLCDILKIAA